MAEANGEVTSDLTAEIAGPLDPEAQLVAAIAYGEASVEDNENEIAGIAHAVVNRARAWKKTISAMLQSDPGYTYAANGHNIRFNLMKKATVKSINQTRAMRIAVNAASQALAGKGLDPSNGAYWWDGVDLMERKSVNPRINQGFKYATDDHNIFDMKPIKKTLIIYWKVRNKKTGEEVDSSERGRYDCVYISTAAQGKTIFWRYNDDYVRATGAKEYR